LVFEPIKIQKVDSSMKFFKPAAICIAAMALSLFALALCCGSGGKTNIINPPNQNPNQNGTVQLSKTFSGANAYGLLQDQVNFGFRIPGTKEHKNCGDWIIAKLKEYGWEVEEQPFTATIRGNTLQMRNIIARNGWISSSQDNIMLAAHWDSRPWADQDTQTNRNKPIQGANDGASGVAVLLELARIFGKTKPLVGVELVFFDGEDYGPELSAMFLGSEYFANKLSQSRINSYRWGILLDMIGDSDLQIHPEHHSEAVASSLYLRMRGIAEEFGTATHFQSTGICNILDDHIPLIEKGIKMYDLIDFDYPYWHTIQDTPDKCSADSLQIVGRVLENLVYREELDMTDY
jgi:glutaminyl-peptide cyclotransferase